MIAMPAYCCTKASVEMLAAVLGQEEPAVTTLAVRPGIVETEMLESLIDEAAESVLSGEQVAFLRGVDKLEAWQPAEALGDLVLGAAHEHSGRCIDWVDADQIIK
jgi:NAD(P)-dependent dehydrogenase (short-subunit alcohol dehydrogenase family)